MEDNLVAMAESMRKMALEIPTPVSYDVPQLFLCPSSGHIMTDPVTLRSGITFDRSTIENFVESGIETCPVTKETLDLSDIVENLVIRELIHEWCRQHKRYLYLFQYSDSTPLKVKLAYFLSLHRKLLSQSLQDQKEAAKELRKGAINMSYFRELYAETPNSVSDILDSLSRNKESSKIDPQIQEDLISVLMIISENEKVKKVIADSPEGICVLIDSLRSENVETMRNAASLLFELSSTDLHRKILTEYIVELATLLIEEQAASYFEKIENNECAGMLLQIIANLSTVKEVVRRIERFGCLYLLRIIRGSLSGKDKECAILILLNVLKERGSICKNMVAEDDISNQTFKRLAQNGNPRVKKMAKEIIEVIKSVYTNVI